MVVAVTKKSASQHRLVYEIVGDNGTTLVTIPAATLVNDAAVGPLKNAFRASYANQDAMRAVIGAGSVEMQCRPRAVSGNWAADVDADAVTPTHPEINVVVPVGVGASAYLVLEFRHSLTR